MLVTLRMYTINVERAKGLMTVTLRGLVPLDEAERYIDEVKRVLVANGMVRYAMVIDLTESPIQPQDTVRAMDEHIAAMPKARSIAIVTGSSLARMQARRLFTQPYARIVATVAQGRAWVLDGVEPAPESAVA